MRHRNRPLDVASVRLLDKYFHIDAPAPERIAYTLGKMVGAEATTHTRERWAMLKGKR